MKDKAGLVFGGSTGIGWATARALLDKGARVAIVSNDAESNKAAVEDTPSEQRERLITLEADVSSSERICEVVNASAEAFGGLDFLVYSAGVQRYGTVVTTSEAVWDEVMTVNLRGAFLAGKFVIPHLAARGRGAIINVSSVQGSACQAGVAAYAASKGAMLALTRAMALDHAAENIRVLSVSPGSVDTPMLRKSAELFAEAGETVEDVFARWGASHPLNRVARPEEVGAVISFLASGEASFMTGAEIRIDGGLTAALPVRLRDQG